MRTKRGGKPGWKVTGSAVLVLFASLAVVLASFALGGFPFRSQVPAQLVWAEVALLALLLGIPLFR